MEETIHDVVMVGAGPSALTAAIYTTREDIDTLLLEKGVVGGLAAVTDWIDNYPGFKDGVAGLALADQLEGQAERFGAKIQYTDVTAIKTDGPVKTVVTEDGDIKARTILLATGSDYRKLKIPGENEYYGRGVHYCATCDGAFYRGKKLVVVGGGNSGVQEALFLTRFTTHIDLLVRSEVKASEVLQKELEKAVAENKITVHLNTVPTEIVANAEGKVEKVTVVENGQNGEVATDGVFVFIGLIPNTAFLKDSGIECDEHGLVKTDAKLQTNLPGVFASGDVRSGATMQIASAVGEGAVAALSIREYLEEQKRAEG